MNRRDALRNTGLILGYSLSAGTVAAVVNGCKAPAEPDWLPSILSSKTIDIVAEIAETILPKTETPGAKEVLVHRFIDEAIKTSFGPNHRKHLIDGINGFDGVCQSATGSSFMDLSKSEREEYLVQLENQTIKINEEFMVKQAQKNKQGEKEPPNAGPMTTAEPTEFRHYYSDLKSLILAGYFTSEKIGKEVLAYDPVPQAYDPCMAITEDTKAWTL